MNFFPLIGIEFKKIRRSKILLILTAATIILWLPSILHADLNFEMQAEGISPENNFLIQGFMGMAWFMFPASMVVSTVLLNMTERNNKAIPMLSCFWLLSVCIQTPVFSIGVGLASIVPSVLMINTKIWLAYPMAYPFFVITSEYGQLATNLDTAQVELIPWIPVAIVITILCLSISCLRFGQAERRSL